MSPDQHLFSLFGRRFLLDVPTGSLLELDEEAVAAFRSPETAPPEAVAEVEALRARGLLGPDPLRQEPPPQMDSRLKALCLHVAHDCNLRCSYCFAGSGSFGGGRSRMSSATGRAAIDYLLASSGPIRQLEVDFFGGEPLLAIETVREVVAHGRVRAEALGKRINFTLTTNATLLDEQKLDFLIREGLSLVLSLDGRPGVHDRFRRDGRGDGSYTRAADGIGRTVSALAASGRVASYYVRGTFTRHNLDFSNDVAHLLTLGFGRLSLEPVVALTTEEHALRPKDLPAIEAEYERLAAFYLDRARNGRPFTFFHFEMDLAEGPCPARRASGCGAGRRYLAVTPDGELYPCHQFVGRTQYLLGDLERGIIRPELAEEFGRADIWRKEGCLDCWARYFCGGGCHANADLHHGDVFTPDEMGCHLLRKRLECALAIKAVRAGEETRGVSGWRRGVTKIS